MCGVLYNHRPNDLAELFDLLEPFEMAPRYNLAPTEPIPTVVTWGRVETTRWGLSMQNPRAKGFNAKSESLARIYPNTRRALVVVSGFYEWRNLTDVPRPKPSDRQPFLVYRSDGAPLVLAGVTDDRGVAIVTAPASGLVRTLHHRMAVVLEAHAQRAWLDPATPARDITAGASSGSLTMHAVAADVGDVRNDHAGLIETVAELPCHPRACDSQLDLFSDEPRCRREE